MRQSKSHCPGAVNPDTRASTGNRQCSHVGWYTGSVIGLVSLALSTSATGAVPSSAAKTPPAPVDQPLDDLPAAKPRSVLVEDELVDARINPFASWNDATGAARSGFSYYRNIMLAQGGDCSRGGGGYSPPSTSRTPSPPPPARTPSPAPSRGSGTAAGVLGIFSTILQQSSQQPSQQSETPASNNPAAVSPEGADAVRRNLEEIYRRQEEGRRIEAELKAEDDARRQGMADPFASTTAGAGQNPFESSAGGGGHDALGASAQQEQACIDMSSRFDADLQAATERARPGTVCTMHRAQRATWLRWRDQFTQSCNALPQFAEETRRRDQTLIVEYGSYIKKSCGG